MDPSKILVENIQNNICDRKISISQLEKQAGLKRSTIYNIVSGKSKNPKISTIISIAKHFDCPIGMLVSSSSHNPAQDKKSNREPKTQDETDIFFDAILFTVNIFKKNKLSPDFKNFYTYTEKSFSARI